MWLDHRANASLGAEYNDNDALSMIAFLAGEGDHKDGGFLDLVTKGKALKVWKVPLWRRRGIPVCGWWTSRISGINDHSNKAHPRKSFYVKSLIAKARETTIKNVNVAARRLTDGAGVESFAFWTNGFSVTS